MWKSMFFSLSRVESKGDTCQDKLRVVVYGDSVKPHIPFTIMRKRGFSAQVSRAEYRSAIVHGPGE